MIKAVLFLDGNWLETHAEKLRQPDTETDFRRLAHATVTEVRSQNRLPPVDLVRCHCFAAGTLCGGLHEWPPLLKALRQRHGFDVQVVADRGQQGTPPGADEAAPAAELADDAAVGVALAASAMRYAAIPGAMDLALLLLGGHEYVPLMQELRRLGKRVALATITDACAEELLDPADAAGVRDFGPLWLDRLVPRLARQHRARPDSHGEPGAPAPVPGQILRGRIKTVLRERGYGFIAAEDGRDYFFHAQALEQGLDLAELEPDLAVVFDVKSGPARGRAAAARSVRPDDTAGETAEEPPAEAADSAEGSREQIMTEPAADD